MQHGVAVATTTDSWRVVERAEALGFSNAWFYDTQLLNPDVFVGMTRAAAATKRIRLGTGVLIPSNRIEPVTANALASLNRIAPGRIDFGVGTGFTGRRTMGLPAIRLADMRTYVERVQALLAGETIEWDFEGTRRRIGFLNPDYGLINIDDPIPLHVSAMGPKARRLTADLGAGWLNFRGSVEQANADLADMQAAWRTAGQTAPLSATLFLMGRVLEPGEPADSEAAVAEAGPSATVTLHALVETTAPGAMEEVLPPVVNDALERYREIYLAYGPEDARYLTNHRGHLMFVRPEEGGHVSAELIRALTFTGMADELRPRLEALVEAGYTQLVVQVVQGQEAALERWGALFRSVPDRQQARMP